MILIPTQPTDPSLSSHTANEFTYDLCTMLNWFGLPSVSVLACAPVPGPERHVWVPCEAKATPTDQPSDTSKR
jgi:hypothetical protein